MQKEKRVITVRKDSKVPYLEYTLPLIKQYAQFCNADLIYLEHECPLGQGDGRWHYRILKNYDILENYDRVLNLDSDILIMPDCPNIFEIVPDDKIGLVYEDKGKRREERHKTIKMLKKEFGNIEWNEGVPNMAVSIVPSVYKDIFTATNGKVWNQPTFDSIYLGYTIAARKYPVIDIGYKYNHMTMFSEAFNNYANRFESYIIHYAGVGIFEKGKFKNKVEQLINDKKYVYGYK